jgi:hypothetical protein
MIEEWRTRFDKNRRISLMKEIADLLMMEEGDYIQFYIDNGRIYLKKETKPYDGFDIENEIIEDRIKKFAEVEEMIKNPISSYKPIFEKNNQNDDTLYTNEENDAEYMSRKQFAYEVFEKELGYKKERKEKGLK